LSGRDEVAALARGVIVTGFDGFEVTSALRERFEAAQFAGYVLFARNAQSLPQVRALTDALRTISRTPPLICVDQEGGRVARLHDGVEPVPAMMAVGAAAQPLLARRAGEQIGHDLRRAGCTIDFAPVLDLALDPRNTVIGTRAFGTSAALVTEMGSAFARGLQHAGITPVFKHFPGHGATAVDSHLALPVIDAGEALIRARDLAPFQACLREGGALMTAHVVVRALDAERPATLSPRILTDLLREEWAFDGVCFTDSMEMDAIARSVGTAAGGAAAIAAGADCVLVSGDFALASQTAEQIAGAALRGSLPMERLRSAHERVLRLRRAAPEPIDVAAPAPHPGIGREIARCAVTLIRGIAHADPTASVVVSFQGVTREGASGVQAEHASLAVQAPVLLEAVAPLDPTREELRVLLERVSATQRRPIVLARRAHLYDGQHRAVDELLDLAPDAIVVSVREPYDVALFDRALHLLAVYDDGVCGIGALADVLFGAGAARGRLPVAL
jgi:beta-N-acetylhexosaminidase